MKICPRTLKEAVAITGLLLAPLITMVIFVKGVNSDDILMIVLSDWPQAVPG